MNKIIKFILISLFLLVGLNGTVKITHAGYVNGYYRSNGTYVQGYYRSNPNAFKYDNYSYDGGELYNTSYYSGYRSNSYNWNTPSYYTQDDYYTGLDYYNSYNDYSSYDSYDYDYSYDSYSDYDYSY